MLLLQANRASFVGSVPSTEQEDVRAALLPVLRQHFPDVFPKPLPVLAVIGPYAPSGSRSTLTTRLLVEHDKFFSPTVVTTLPRRLNGAADVISNMKARKPQLWMQIRTQLPRPPFCFETIIILS